MADNDTAKVGQHWNITLKVPGDDGSPDIATDGPLVWTSDNATVIMPRNVSADGKTGMLEAIIPSQVDQDGNPVPVIVTFVVDGDPGSGVKTLTAQTVPLFSVANPAVGSAIVIEMSPPEDSGTIATPRP